jgi:hypothetical protein
VGTESDNAVLDGNVHICGAGLFNDFMENDLGSIWKEAVMA